MNGQPITKPPTADELLAEATKLSASGDKSGAISLLKTAMGMAPDNHVIANELGVAFYHLGDIPNAQAYFQKAVDIKPDFVRGLTNLGACFNERKDNFNAIKCYTRALDLQPNMVDAWGNLAKAWTESEEQELAVYAYQKVISLNPKGEFYRGLAKAYRKSGRYERSEQALQVSIEKNPEDHDAHFGMAYTYFHLEKYPEAIQEFEWRWKTKDLVKHKQDLYPIFNAPAYDGSQDLSDKTVLLHTEQGFGDNLQFARFIDLVRPRVKKLVMWTRPGLARLFKNSFDIEETSENVFKLPAFDYHLPLLSIPYYFDKELETLSRFKPYLSAPPNDALTVNTAKGKVNIGLVWGASDTGFDHANKRVPLELLRPLMETPGTQWYSLQVGSDRKDLNEGAKSFPLIDLGENLKDFADTARVVEQLDLIISVDTSVAHLAGAIGKEAWLMLKKNPDWRWHADGPGSIWYPSARLYRQDSFGDWSSVERRVRRDLHRLLAERPEAKS